MNVLAADIGGTNARFALGVPDDDALLRVVTTRTYESQKLDGPPEGVRRFLRESGTAADTAVVAIAGPVRGSAGTVTNRGWTVEVDELRKAADIRDVVLLNDFVALGSSLPHLGADDLVEFQRGRADAEGVVALLGAGTGLGQALLVPGDRGEPPTTHATEGGHCDFAPRTEIEWEIQAFLRRRSDHVAWEHVLSGGGLCALYDYLVESGRVREDPGTRRAMETTESSHVISGRGLAGTDPACVATLELFARLYGSRAGSVALALGATGGVFVGGGLVRHVLPALRRGGFMEAFRDKGRMRSWLAEVPVRAIVREDSGLLGAMILGIRRSSSRSRPAAAEARR